MPSLGADAMMKVRDVGKFIRDQRRTASLSLRKLSSLAGVSNPYLSQIERGLRRPSAEILKEIAKALSISAETLYIKAGILDERADDVDTVGNIRRDASISEKQKQLLIQLYESFKAPEPAAQRARRTTRPAATGTKPPRTTKKTSSARPKTAARGTSASARKPAKKAAGRPGRPGKKTTTKKRS